MTCATQGVRRVERFYSVCTKRYFSLVCKYARCEACDVYLIEDSATRTHYVADTCGSVHPVRNQYHDNADLHIADYFSGLGAHVSSIAPNYY